MHDNSNAPESPPSAKSKRARPRRSRVQYTFTLNDEKWKALLVDRELFNDAGEPAAATTERAKRIITFCSEDFSRGAIIHELFHAYSTYLFLSSTNLDLPNIEEIYAEFWERNLTKFSNQVREIYRALRTKKEASSRASEET